MKAEDVPGLLHVSLRLIAACGEVGTQVMDELC